MCGIIGVVSTENKIARGAAEALLHQSEVRGRHATGISYYDAAGQLTTFKQPVPANEFEMPDDVGNILIGHTRYSTSDIEYNQPLTEGDCSLVHNGVITQAPFTQWESLYGFTDFKTRNDSEILLKAWQQDMFYQFENASIAAGFLAGGEIFCYRNQQRPLYIFYNEYLQGFASTYNIIQRTFGDGVTIVKAEPNVIYNLRIKTGKLHSCSIDQYEAEKKPDLQFDTVRGDRYLYRGSVSTHGC